MMREIDRIDQRILARLRTSARTTVATLAKELGRSRTAVQARVGRLEEDGYIRGYHAVIGAGRDDSRAPAMIVLIYLHDRLAPQSVTMALAGMPEVMACYNISGDADLAVLLSETCRERLERLLEEIWALRAVRSTHTILVIKRHFDFVAGDAVPDR